MKKLITIILTLVLLLPAAALAEKDPIIGGWYITLDYRDIAGTAGAENRAYMIYIMYFEDTGTITGISAESSTSGEFVSQGSVIGNWSRQGDDYTVNVVGLGETHPTIENGRLIVKMVDTVHYSMRRMEQGSWFTDILYR